MYKIIISFLFILIPILSFGQSPEINKYDKKELNICDNDSVYIVMKRDGDVKKYGMLDMRDKILLSADYEHISRFGKILFLVRFGDKYGIYNAKGRELLPIEYTLPISFLTDTYYTISKDDKKGVFDVATEKVIFPADYYSIYYRDSGIEPFFVEPQEWVSKDSINRTAVAIKDSANIKCQSLLDLKSHQVLIPCGLYDNILPSDRYGSVYLQKGNNWEIISYKGDKYLSDKDYYKADIVPFGFITTDSTRLKGFVPLEGKVVLPTYKEIIFANNGIAIIKDKYGKKGAIRHDGKLILSPEYDFLYIEPKDILFVKNGKTGIADFNGEIIFQPNKYDDIKYYPDDQVAVVCIGDKYGLINKKGKILIPVKYRNVYYDSGIARIGMGTSHYKLGMYNIKTKKLIKPKYDGLEKFVDGISVIGYFSAQGNKYGLINEAGVEQVKPVYGTMFFDDQQQYATVTLGRKHGMIDRKGNIIVPVEYDEFKEYRPQNDKNGIAIVCSGDKYGVFNFHQAIELLPPIYDQIVDFRYGSGGLRYLRDGKYGFISYDGKTILPQEYDFIGTVSGGLKLEKNKKYGISDYKGQLLTPIEYDGLIPFFAPNYQFDVVACKDGKWGIIDIRGNVMIEFDFDQLKYSYELNKYIARKGQQVGFINRRTKQFYTDDENEANIKAELEK